MASEFFRNVTKSARNSDYYTIYIVFNSVILGNTESVSMISGINNNNAYGPSKEKTKRKYSPPLRFKILQFFESLQPFLVGSLCIGMAILLPIVVSNHFEQDQLQGKMKLAYERLQSRLKSVENRAGIPGSPGHPGIKGDQGVPGRNGLTGPKGN